MIIEYLIIELNFRFS